MESKKTNLERDIKNEPPNKKRKEEIDHFERNFGELMKIDVNGKENNLVRIFEYLFHEEILINHLAFEKLIDCEKEKEILNFILQSLDKDKVFSINTHVNFLNLLFHFSKIEKIQFEKIEIEKLFNFYFEESKKGNLVFMFIKLINLLIKNEENRKTLTIEKITKLKVFMDSKFEHFVHKKVLKLYLNYLNFDKSISIFCIENLPLDLRINFEEEEKTSLNEENQFIIKRISWIIYLKALVNLENDTKKISNFTKFFDEVNTEHFIQFFSGDDKFFIKFLILMLKIYPYTNEENFNPILLFYQFLCFLDFDHEICFEFLISNETNFLEYLLLILKHKKEFSSFEYKEEIHEFLLTFQEKIVSYQKNEIFPYNSKVLIDKLKTFIS
eukprot:gene736-8988_t